MRHTEGCLTSACSLGNSVAVFPQIPRGSKANSLLCSRAQERQEASNPLTENFRRLRFRPVALSSCPECRKELSDTALNCPHCGWRKSRVGLVLAWIIAIVIVALAVLFYYQIDQANKAEAAFRKEMDKADRMIKALKP
jgi:hypothetical protein